MADSEVIINSDQIARDILLDKTFHCEWQDAYFSGTDQYTFNFVSLELVRARVTNSECTGTALFKGQFDGSQLKGIVSGYRPNCGLITTSKSFFQKADGSYYYTGFYESHIYNAPGVFRCKPTQ